MRLQFICFLLIGFFNFSSCDLLKLKDDSLSSDEIVKGIKTVLYVGTDSAVLITSTIDGYLKDEAIQIKFPEEAMIIVSNIDKVPNGQTMLNNVILLLNRSAEDAAKSAGPILKNSISALSIKEGLSII